MSKSTKVLRPDVYHRLLADAEVFPGLSRVEQEACIAEAKRQYHAMKVVDIPPHHNRFLVSLVEEQAQALVLKNVTNVHRENSGSQYEPDDVNAKEQTNKEQTDTITELAEVKAERDGLRKVLNVKEDAITEMEEALKHVRAERNRLNEDNQRLREERNQARGGLSLSSGST